MTDGSKMRHSGEIQLWFSATKHMRGHNILKALRSFTPIMLAANMESRICVLYISWQSQEYDLKKIMVSYEKEKLSQQSSDASAGRAPPSSEAFRSN